MKKIISYLNRSLIMELKTIIAYPASFWIVVFLIPFFTIVRLIFIESIFSQTSTFLGYTKYEAYILMGTYTIVQTIGHLLFFNKLAGMKDLIRGGTQQSFDNLMIKPIDSQILTTTGRFDLGNIGPFIFAVFVIFYGLQNDNQLLEAFNIISYIITIFMGVIIFYLVFLLIDTLLFWYPEMQMTNELSESIRDLGQYPANLYSGSLGLIFNLVIPVTLMASIPSEFLLGRQPSYMLAVYTGIVVILYILTRLFWKKGVNNYSSFST